MENEPNNFSYDLKIPKERVAVLIGKKGEVKAKIEEETGCSVNVDSDEGEVRVLGSDAIMLYQAREIIKAVARGFNPEVACLLLKGDYVLEIISLNDYSRHKNHQQRLKGRVIGTKGKSRNLIEQMTETFISVYGKTICIIGRNDNVSVARKAVETLLSGSPHSTVYKWLEKQKRDLKVREIEGPEKVDLKEDVAEEIDKIKDMID